MERSVADEIEEEVRPACARNSVDVCSSVAEILEFPDAIDPRV